MTAHLTPHMNPFESYSLDILDATLPSIHTLNDDGLDLILGYMDGYELLAVRFVCKRWFNAVVHSLATLDHHNMTSRKFRSTLSDFRLATLIGSSLKRLYVPVTLFAGSTFTAEEMLEKLPNLEILRIKNNDSRAKSFFDMSPSTQVLGLKCLQISNVIIKPLEDDVISNLIIKLPDLQKIEITNPSGNPLMSSGNLDGMFFSNHLKDHEMRSIILRNMVNLETDLPWFIFNQYYSTLECLSIRSVQCELDFFDVDGLQPMKRMKTFCITTSAREVDELLPLLSLMPNLETLELFLQHASADQPSFVSILVEICPHITHLTLSCRNAKIPFSELESLKDLKFLKTLNLPKKNRLVFDMFEGVMEGLTTLETLSLQGCSGLKDEHVFIIITKMKSLRRLNIR